MVFRLKPLQVLGVFRNSKSMGLAVSFYIIQYLNSYIIKYYVKKYLFLCSQIGIPFVKILYFYNKVIVFERLQSLKPIDPMQKYLPIYSLVLASFLTLAIFSSSSNSNTAGQEKEPAPTSQASDNSVNILPQIIHSIDMNKVYTFAGERVPTENFDVKERLDRELTVNSYRHSATIQYIKLAHRYFPVIEPILAKYEIPNDFKYLAVAESGLRNAISSAGAKGLWQFMKGTGRDYGLEINSEVDERYHLEKSTKAACKFLKKLKERHGTWALAAAAYNSGSSRVKGNLESQKETSYYDLNMNQETSRYLFRIIALKEILSNPSDFGFQISDENKYQPLTDFSIVDFNKPVPSWADFAKQYGITYRMLKVYNPWILDSSFRNVSGSKTYGVKIPRN